VRHLLQLSLAELKAWLVEQGEKGFRAAQVRKWLFDSRCRTFDEMTDLGKGLREKLAAEFSLWTMRVVHTHQAVDGTEKLVLETHDRERIECVLLRDGTRRTICISSQVGCAMGCVFCASGLDGVVRNLTTGEIIEQMLLLQRLLPAEERLSHIVVMGMGEPLANLGQLLPALEAAAAEDGLGISHRLAVSLHAPNDELRDKLVPVNKSTGLDAILEAADTYFEASGRRLTFEYVLLGNLNDRIEHAQELAELLAGRLALLNVIPYNRVAGLPYEEPTNTAKQRFMQTLTDAGINVQIRERKGDEINAACGQLRRVLQQDGPQLVELKL
jgi:23S rRNA (adenine2503-C2)-methyltransferase